MTRKPASFTDYLQLTHEQKIELFKEAVKAKDQEKEEQKKNNTLNKK